MIKKRIHSVVIYSLIKKARRLGGLSGISVEKLENDDRYFVKRMNALMQKYKGRDMIPNDVLDVIDFFIKVTNKK